MPYVNVKITREGATRAQKQALVQAITEALQRILAKDPRTTFVVIDEVALEDWGIGGLLVEEYRRRDRLNERDGR
ncbi:MAG: 4-oxalocrotonate tautomerase family protein [Planctomycetes bacterium]|nr:4-oxalocrotonate tautomerase family protein [Planctomycetota bacterium]